MRTGIGLLAASMTIAIAVGVGAQPLPDEPDDADEALEALEALDEPPDEEAPDPFDSFEVPTTRRDDMGPGLQDESIEDLSREDLIAAGFEFGAETTTVDTSTAVLLATTVGTALHGVGHLYMGDTRTGFFLLGMEGVSIGLLASSFVYYALTEGATPAAAFFAPALQLGVATFIYSYILDVVGTLNGPQRELPPNVFESRGVGFQARYGLFSSASLPFRSVIDAALLLDIGGLYAQAATVQDVFLDASAYRGQIGLRPVRGRSDLTYFALEANGEFFEWAGEGEFARIGADARVAASWQLGDGFPHLDQFALRGELGFGYHWYQLAPAGSSTFAQALVRPYVPFDIVASINLSERFNVAGGYGTSHLSFVPPIHRMLGIAHLDFRYRTSSIGDISIRTELGDGFAVWLGGSFWFVR